MDLQTYEKALKTGFDFSKTLLSCDWLEFRITGELDFSVLRPIMGNNYKLKSSATYRNIIELQDYTIMWGVRGIQDNGTIHVKFNNEFLYSMNFSNPYHYFELLSPIFKYRNISKCYIARMDLCCDMSYNSPEYYAVKQRFETNRIGTYPRRKVCQSLYKEYFNDNHFKLHYGTGVVEDLSNGVEPTNITKTKRYNNRGCLAYNYSAGSRQGDFYFRFYDKTLENTGVSDLAKKEYIKAIHEKYLPNSQRVYRLECEIKLPYLPVTCATFNEIAKDLFGYYFGMLPYQGFLFRPEFGRRPQTDDITAEKKQRICNVLSKYLKHFPERENFSISQLITTLQREIDPATGLKPDENVTMSDNELKNIDIPQDNFFNDWGSLMKPNFEIE